MTAAHIIQVAIISATLLAIAWVFVMLVRAVLRANPARARFPWPWQGLDAFRAYVAAIRLDPEIDEDADEQPVEDLGAEWDRARARARDIDYRAGVA